MFDADSRRKEHAMQSGKGKGLLLTRGHERKGTHEKGGRGQEGRVGNR